MANIVLSDLLCKDLLNHPKLQSTFMSKKRIRGGRDQLCEKNLMNHRLIMLSYHLHTSRDAMVETYEVGTIAL